MPVDYSLLPNAMGFNFQPINQGLNALAEGFYRRKQQDMESQNALLRQRQVEQESARADERLGMQRTEFAQGQGDRKVKAAAGIAQTLLDMKPEQRASAIAQIHKMDPKFGDTLAQDGIDINNVEQWAPIYIARARGYQDPLERRKLQAEIAKTEADAAGGNRLSLQPVYGFDDAGKPVVLQASPRGELVPSRVPQGITVDPYANAERKARATVAGKSEGQAASNLPLAEAAATRIVGEIDALLSDKGLSRITGPLQGVLPNVTSGARRAQSRLDKIQGGTFLQAYNDLRGGGQITEKEGEKATAAYNRLTTQSMGDDDYRAALIEFKDEVVKLVDIARQRAGVGTAPQSGGWSIRALD